MRTAYVHIGPHKTGTTALQASISASRDHLAKVGILVPSGPPNNSIMLSTIFWDLEKASEIGQLEWIDDRDEFAAHRSSVSEQFEREIAESDCPNILLSGEELSRFTVDEAKAFYNFLYERYDRVQTIAFGRAPLSSATSMAQQRLKWSGKTFEEIFSKLPNPDYDVRFSPHLRVNGVANFTLIPYRTKAEGFNVVDEFAKAIGLDPEILVQPSVEESNFSISRESLMMLSAINKQIPQFVNNRHNPLRAFRVVKTVSAFPGEKFILPFEVVEGAREKLEKDREWLNGFWGGEVFPAEAVPKTVSSDWFLGQAERLGEFGQSINQLCAHKQNENALRSLLRAEKMRDTDRSQAASFLSNARLLATDLWTMHHVTALMNDFDHPEAGKSLAKMKFMKRLLSETEEPSSLKATNPFDRW